MPLFLALLILFKRVFFETSTRCWCDKDIIWTICARKKEKEKEVDGPPVKERGKKML